MIGMQHTLCRINKDAICRYVVSISDEIQQKYEYVTFFETRSVQHKEKKKSEIITNTDAESNDIWQKNADI